MEPKVVDCRSDEGITIGLVDSILTVARILARRDLLNSLSILDALSDLSSDEDLAYLMRIGKEGQPLD